MVTRKLREILRSQPTLAAPARERDGRVLLFDQQRDRRSRHKTDDTHRVFYARARATLVDHLRKADPPLAETFIERELRALEGAISKVEASGKNNHSITSSTRASTP